MPIRVYIEDTDAGGVVFYANYLKYMERARTECLREQGIDLGHWQHTQRRLFVVRSATIDYRKPARCDDLLHVSANIVTLKRASLVLSQPVMREQSLLVEATVRLACVDADTLLPKAIPVEIQEALTRGK